MPTNYKAWENSFNKHVKTTTDTCSKTVIEASKILLGRIENRTPVGNPSLWGYKAPEGYTPGTLKASWTMSFSKKNSGVRIEIANDQPYAERVEFGWSKQAPYGMMRVSLKEWPDVLDTVGKSNKL